MSLGCNSFNANKQEQDTKDLSFSRLLARGLEIGGDEPLIGNPEHYDSDVGTEDTKYLSTTGAEYGYRGVELEIAKYLRVAGRKFVVVNNFIT